MGVSSRLKHAPSALLRFARKPVRVQATIVGSGVLLLAVRASLGVFPYRRVLSSVERLAHRFSARRPHSISEAKSRANVIESTAAHLFPANPCLPQALVVCLVFWRNRLPASLEFGAARSEQGALEAHAWVESEGEIVIGEAEKMAAYARFHDVGEGT